MRLIDLKSNDEFNPNSKEWPAQAVVEEFFVNFRIMRKGDEVIAEDPKLIWDLKDFLEIINQGKGMKELLAGAKNIIKNPDDFTGTLRIKTWFCEKPRLAFQVAYEPVKG